MKLLFIYEIKWGLFLNQKSFKDSFVFLLTDKRLRGLGGRRRPRGCWPQTSWAGPAAPPTSRKGSAAVRRPPKGRGRGGRGLSGARERSPPSPRPFSFLKRSPRVAGPGVGLGSGSCKGKDLGPVLRYLRSAWTRKRAVAFSHFILRTLVVALGNVEFPV